MNIMEMLYPCPIDHRYRFIILFIIPVIFLSLQACKKQQAPTPLPPAVTVTQPVQREVTDFLEATGTTHAIPTVQLTARVAGYLEKKLFKDGQFVKRGQLLFLIQQNTYQANLQQAEGTILLQKAQLEYAAKEFTRFSNLLARNAASQTDVDNWRNQRDAAQGNLLTAEANRDLARLNLDYTEVRAPFDGRIDRTLVDPGNLVGSGQPTTLATISQTDPIYVYFTISDSDLARLMNEARWNPSAAIQKPLPAYMGLAQEKGYVRKGQLDFASITLTPTSGTLLLRARFPNPQGTVMPGLFARLQVPLQKIRALLVPQEAIRNDQRGSYVFIVNDRNVVERRDVKTGFAADNMRVVQQGLNGDEWIIAKGLQKVAPGKLVTSQQRKNTRPAPPQGLGKSSSAAPSQLSTSSVIQAAQ